MTTRQFRSLVAPIVFIVSVVGAGVSFAQNPTPIVCDGAPVSRLSVGAKAVVADGGSSNVRTSPGLSGKVLRILKGGQSFDIVNGPRCVDGFVWWETQIDGQFGFLAEGKGSSYYIEPLAPAAVATVGADGNVNVNSDGVAFSFAGTVAPAVTEFAVPENTVDESGNLGMGIDVAPAAVEFALFDGSENTAYPRSTVTIYPANGFAPLNASSGETLDALRLLINDESANSKDEIPEVPVIEARQVVRSAVKYIALADGGKGVRFITWYAPAPTYASNENVRYEFRGFSADGVHYISAQFALHSAALPDTVDNAAMNAQLSTPDGEDQYEADTAQMLTNLRADQFTPNLDQLDALVQSVSFING